MFRAVGLTARLHNLYTAYWHQREQLQTSSLAWPVLMFVVVTAVHLTLIPFIERTWRATGDEPHYLLAAHSLVADWDFDLANNYAQLDYLAFYLSRDIVPQIRLSPSGQQLLDHALGLPVIIAPAYALGGRLGVLIFQAIIGGLLGLITFKLAMVLSNDEFASFWATLMVIFTPPLFFYHYLIYPELLGALFVTLLLYAAISSTRPGWSMFLLVLVALIALPWLNRRFVPLALLLAVLIIWNWRTQHIPRYIPGLLIIGCTFGSLLLLFWLNSQLTGPERIDITAPATGSLFWRRLVRGIGWLLDQQRGLFIYAPVYLLAVWGLPILVSRLIRSWREPRQQSMARVWAIIVPFSLSLGLTAVAGGFWIAWELGPRFLIVALPALAPLIALAWRYYGRFKGWWGLVVLLLGLSLLNLISIIRSPELPYKSSLPLHYGQMLQLPLIEWLPDLADYADIHLTVSETDLDMIETTISIDQPAWLVQAGQSGPVIKSDPLYELPFGHYQLQWPLQLASAPPPTAELGRISIKQLGGGQILNKVIMAADISQENKNNFIKETFLNPNVDRWRTPMVLQAVTTGEADIKIGPIKLRPTLFHGWFLPYFYLSLIVAGACLSWYWFARPLEVSDLSLQTIEETQETKGALDKNKARGLALLPPGLSWSLILIIVALTVTYFIIQYNQSGRTYAAGELLHFIGRAVTDPKAEDGQAWLVDPMIDPPQKAIYGPFDFYDTGHYQVAFRLKLPEPVSIEQEIARIQVNATTNFDNLVTQPLRPNHFNQVDLYHDFVLQVDNPRRQALSFELHYLGLAALAIDQVTITKVTHKVEDKP